MEIHNLKFTEYLFVQIAYPLASRIVLSIGFDSPVKCRHWFPLNCIHWVRGKLPRQPNAATPHRYIILIGIKWVSDSSCPIQLQRAVCEGDIWQNRPVLVCRPFFWHLGTTQQHRANSTSNKFACVKSAQKKWKEKRIEIALARGIRNVYSTMLRVWKIK